MSDLTDIKIFLTSVIRPIIKEAIREEIHHLNTVHPVITNTDPNGDFSWLKHIFPGIPENTLRQWDAAGKIPGSSKFGKRRIYHKQTVLDWQRSQTRQIIDIAKIEQTANLQIEKQLNKQRKGGRKTV